MGSEHETRAEGTTVHEAEERERAGWRALSSTAEEAEAFWSEHLDDPVLFLLPGGLVVDDRAEAVRSMGGQPWSEHRLADLRVLQLADDVAVVGYAVTAVRGEEPAYDALVSSTWVRRAGGWRLAVHQQTPG